LRLRSLRPDWNEPTRGGVGWLGQVLVALALGYLINYLWLRGGPRGPWDPHRFVWWPIVNERTSWIPWIPVSILAGWRWTWVLVHWIRAATYRLRVFPRLRREAEAEVATRGAVPELAVLVVTYKEDPNITRVVFESIFEEAARVEGLDRHPVIVAVTGSDADDEGIRAARDRVAGRVPPGRRAKLVLMRGTDGKRRALAAGLEWIRRWHRSPDGAFVAMDGDTKLEPGALSRSLCFFRLQPTISALTTNEHAIVRAPGWFCEWIHLRHGQRNLYASSLALSRRLLCLTGRFSVFRADVLDDGFIEIVRNDHVRSWLWGDYALLSGDDKSTWFNLLGKGLRMLYVPDVAVITHEAVQGSAAVRAYHNLRRWGGNLIRNSERAISLGPRRVGPFTWWCLLDQRVSMWTILVGPLAFLLMMLSGRVDLACVYLLWVVVSRSVRVVPSWLHGRRVSLLYAPLSALLDTAGALVKIWIVYFPAKQFWFNRGHRQLDSTKGRSRLLERRAAAGTLLGSALLALVGFVSWLTGSLQPGREAALLLDELRAGPALFLVLGLLPVLVGSAVALAARLGRGGNA
jgi:glycosyltransferase Alg8